MDEWEGTKGNEGGDPFGVRSAMQRKMRERGDDPASRARAEAERQAGAEVTDDEIAEFLGADRHEHPGEPGSGAEGPGDADGAR